MEYDFILGLTYSEAREELNRRGVSFRIYNVDGASKILTRDFVPDRLNIRLINNIVVEYNMG